MIDAQTAFNLERPLLIALSTLYGLALVFYSPPAMKAAGKMKRAGWIIHLCALLVHSFLLYARITTTGHAPLSSLYETLLALSWSVSFVFIVLSWRRHTFGYGRAASLISWTGTLAGLLLYVFAPGMVIPRYLPAMLGSPFFEAHAATSFLAYGCFILAFFAALTSLWAKKPTGSERRRVAEFYLWPGIILFTLSLSLAGAACMLTWGTMWRWGAKTILSVTIWGFFFLALVSRGNKRWGKAAFPFLVVAGFLAMVLTYLFANQGFHDFI